MKEKYICFQFSLVVRRSYGHVLENMEFFNTTLSRQILPREYINQIKIVLDCLKQYIGVNLVKKTYNCQKTYIICIELHLMKSYSTLMHSFM